MTNNHTPFEKQLDSGAAFKSDLLGGLDKTEWPGRIDYVASRVTDGDYIIGIQSSDPTYLSTGYDLEKAAREYYLRGIAALTGDTARMTALPDSFQLGNLLVEFAGLREGLENVDRRDIPPGEILSRLMMRTVQRQADEGNAQLARQLRPDTETPRELVTELTTAPELAPLVESSLPDSDDPATLTTELASLDLTTELWDHQLESLALWLYHDMNAYVDMATATGKTVLGLAAVAHTVDSGSLHPADQERLDEVFDGTPPDPHRNRPNDVLIVTTDDLLGVQWARLFQDHCHTPPEFTNIENNGIQLPWGRIDIRSAKGLDNANPSDYRLAIFDEVHNYSGRSGWGRHLEDFIQAPCPVLALTGSVTDQLESLAARTDRPFPLVYRYTHQLALADGVIPDFEWTLSFTEITDSEALGQFRETAQQFEKLVEYDSGTYRIKKDALAAAEPDLAESERSAIAGEYVSGSALATGIREQGDDGTAPTDTLESFASGASNRTIHRLNLRASLDPVLAIAEKAISEERPVLILTRSYGEAKDLWQDLYDGDDNRFVNRLDADQSASDHDATIRSFDEADTDRKVLIGPGKRIGQGNDIQSVEVGINIARPGSGVNTTLVQRLGRLLRDAGGKDTVDFYHVVGVPPEDATIGPDGEAFVRTVAEFFGQVLEPDTDGILKAPSVSVAGSVERDVVALEQSGAPHTHDDDQATMIESAYAAAIDEQRPEEEPAVATDWFSAAFGDEVQRSLGPDSRDGHEEQTETDQSETASTDDDKNGTDSESDTGSDKNKKRTQAEQPDDVDVAERVSPLAEHYEAFRSLGIIHKAVKASVESEIPDSSSSEQWIRDVRSIVTDEGYGDQETGYGRQQKNRSPFKISEYRSVREMDGRLTEFESVDVCSPSVAVTALLDDTLRDLASWVVPVTPDSGTPLPILVESEQELSRARSLLDEFPAEPAVFANEKTDDSTAKTEKSTAEPSLTSNQRASQNRDSIPVENVRGVSDSVADALRESGYERLSDLQRASDQELAAVESVSEQRVQLIRATVGSKS